MPMEADAMPEKRWNVAVVGATGAVGEVLVEILEQRKFPIGELHLLASQRSEGKTTLFRGKTHRIERLEEFD